MFFICSTHFSTQACPVQFCEKLWQDHMVSLDGCVSEVGPSSDHISIGMLESNSFQCAYWVFRQSITDSLNFTHWDFRPVRPMQGSCLSSYSRKINRVSGITSGILSSVMFDKRPHYTLYTSTRRVTFKQESRSPRPAWGWVSSLINICLLRLRGSVLPSENLSLSLRPRLTYTLITSFSFS